MKNLILVFAALVMIVTSCTKQASNKLAQSVSQQQASKGNKGKNSVVNSTLSTFTASSSSNNTVQWITPALQPGNKYTWVEVDWGTDSAGVWLKSGGIMKYVNSTTEVNSFTNGSWTSGSVKPGTWQIIVRVFEATPNPLVGEPNQPDYITSSWISHYSNRVTVTFN